jgi:hypothetical protein
MSAPEPAQSPVPALLAVHGVMLIVFDGLLGFAGLRSTSLTAALTGERTDMWKLLAPVLVLVAQTASVAMVLACAAYELAVAYRTTQGVPLSHRTAALFGVLGSLLLVPPSLVGCSLCGLAFWPLPLGFALATCLVAYRLPDPRTAPPAP